MIEVLRYFNERLEESLLLRWTLANVVGWSVGWYLASGAVAIIGGLVGLFVAGALAALTAAAAQMVALRGTPLAVGRDWVLFSTVGGTLGALPVLLVSFSLIAGQGVGFAVMGAVFGLCFGWTQTLLMRPGGAAMIWLVVNIVAGGLCGTFSMNGVPFALPIFCTLGPVSFGLITGAALVRLVRSGELNNLE